MKQWYIEALLGDSPIDHKKPVLFNKAQALLVKQAITILWGNISPHLLTDDQTMSKIKVLVQITLELTDIINDFNLEELISEES